MIQAVADELTMGVSRTVIEPKYGLAVQYNSDYEPRIPVAVEPVPDLDNLMAELRVELAARTIATGDSNPLKEEIDTIINPQHTPCMPVVEPLARLDLRPEGKVCPNAAQNHTIVLLWPELSLIRQPN